MLSPGRDDEDGVDIDTCPDVALEVVADADADVTGTKAVTKVKKHHIDVALDADADVTVTRAKQCVDMDMVIERFCLTSRETSSKSRSLTENFKLDPTGIMKMTENGAHWNRIDSNGFLDFPQIT